MALLHPGLAHADARAEARRLFRAGMALIEAGRHREGIDNLRAAHELLPHAAVLYNIGRAYADAGDYGEAIRFLERYLAAEPADKVEVGANVDALRERLQRSGAVAATAAVGSSPVPAPSAGSSSTAARPPASAPGAAPVSATPDEIAALEAAARKLEAIAEATESRSVHEQATELSSMASRLRERSGAYGTSGNGAFAVAQKGPDRGPEIELGAEHTDVYEEEVVSASRFAQSPLDAPNSTTVVTAQDIRLTGLTNIADLLRRAAGLDVMQLTPGDTQVSIRGLNQRMSNKVLVLINGRSVYLDFLGSTFWYFLPVSTEGIERIEIIRGPASALYGADAFAGVVNIILREPGTGRSIITAAGGDGRVARGNVTASGRANGLMYRVGGGYERADHHTLVVDPQRVDISAAADDPVRGLERHWLDADMRYTIAPGYVTRFGTGVASGYVSFMGLGRLRQLDARDGLFAQTHGSVSTPLGLILRTFWNTFRGAVAQVQHAPGDLSMDTRDVTSNVADVELELARRVDLGFEHAIALGAGYRYKTIAWEWLDAEHQEHHTSAYFQDTMRVAHFLSVVASARLDRHPLLDGPQISPRGSLVFRPTERSALRATVGTAFRSPSFVESYVSVANPTPVRGVTGYGVGNQTLMPERIVSAEIGYGNQQSDRFAVDASLYYNIVDQQIVFNRALGYTLSDYPGLDDGAMAYPVSRLQFANEDATYRQLGAEIGVRAYPVSGVDVYVNYAVHDTSPTENTAELGVRRKDQRTSRHKVNAGVQLRSSSGADLAFDLHYVSGQNWVEQVVDPQTGIGFEEFALHEYVLVNVRAGYRLFADRAELAVVGTNLLGYQRRHREHPFGERIGPRVMGTLGIRF